MPINPQDFSDRMFRILLQAYPAAFRQQFANEMAQVFRALSRQTYHQAGVSGLLHLWFSTIWDLVPAVMYQWWVSLIHRRTVIMQTTPAVQPDRIQPLSAMQAGIAALPFLVFGIISLVSKLVIFQPGAARLTFWQAVILQPYLWFYGFILIGLAAGLVAGFPRWAYAYLGWALLFGWWWGNMRFYGYETGWKIWLPALGVFLVVLIIRRSFQPLRALFTGFRRDWTLPSLGLYVFYGFVELLYDENHHPYLLVFMALTTLAVTTGAWGYFRSAHPLHRIVFLIAGLLLAHALGVTSWATWDYRTFYGLPEGGQNDILVGAIYFAVLAVLMFGNGLLAHSRLREN